LLCAEGILQEDLIVEENVRVFDDSLFCVHLQRQYSAARELEDFIRTNNVDIRNIQDPNLAKYFQALKVCLLPILSTMLSSLLVRSVERLRQ
jgi:hypothetical protein